MWTSLAHSFAKCFLSKPLLWGLWTSLMWGPTWNGVAWSFDLGEIVVFTTSSNNILSNKQTSSLRSNLTSSPKDDAHIHQFRWKKKSFMTIMRKALPFGNVSPFIVGLTLYVYFQVLWNFTNHNCCMACKILQTFWNFSPNHIIRI